MISSARSTNRRYKRPRLVFHARKQRNTTDRILVSVSSHLVLGVTQASVLDGGVPFDNGREHRGDMCKHRVDADSTCVGLLPT